MVRRGTSIGFFGMFGRSQDLRRLDRAMREAGLHPALIPEGAKLAAIGVIAGEDAREPPPLAYPPIGELMAFCALGSEIFAQENGPERLETAEQRLEAALESGTGTDAQIVLLMLHAKLIHPEIVDRYDIHAVDKE